MDAFNKAFAEADKKVHKVEDQWHYPIMAKAGYVPLTKEAVGFSRSYDYEHPVTKHRMTLTTGCNADYWTDGKTKKFGYWADLEPHLKAL